MNMFKTYSYQRFLVSLCQEASGPEKIITHPTPGDLPLATCKLVDVIRNIIQEITYIFTRTLDMVTQDDLTSKLEAQIPNIYHAFVTDTSNGCGQAYDVVVVSNSFLGKNRLARCRLVNKALAEEVAQIHAFSAKCYTVQEWNDVLEN